MAAPCAVTLPLPPRVNTGELWMALVAATRPFSRGRACLQVWGEKAHQYPGWSTSRLVPACGTGRFGGELSGEYSSIQDKSMPYTPQASPSPPICTHTNQDRNQFSN